jgi:hypothetical protein
MKRLAILGNATLPCGYTPPAVRGPVAPFDMRAFLDSAGITRRKVLRYARASVVFAQGGPANSVFYILPTTVLRIQKGAMMRTLHEQSALSDRFIAHMLARNIQIEEDLVDHLFNSSEKRLARTLLLLARYGDDHMPVRRLPRISHETLAEMVGTTRSRVNAFMNKFRKLGLIKYNGTLTIDSALLSVVLHDSRH